MRLADKLLVDVKLGDVTLGGSKMLEYKLLGDMRLGDRTLLYDWDIGVYHWPEEIIDKRNSM